MGEAITHPQFRWERSKATPAHPKHDRTTAIRDFRRGLMAMNRAPGTLIDRR